MVISIDYDDTWTADPQGWQQVVTLMRRRGHTVILITNRPNLPPSRHEVERDVRGFVDAIIFAGIPTPKRLAAERHGYHVDVWIDDCPSAVDHGR
jgi:hypothetical protein